MACAGVVFLAGCARPEPPNIVLITLDTTRADHLGAYGYAAAVTPHLDRFAKTAVLYENAYATSSWTLPSHASLLTGLLPMQHGAQTAPLGPVARLGYGVRPLAEHFITLAERLREAGYVSAGVVGGPALDRELGVAQGFDYYEDDLGGAIGVVVGKRAEKIADRAIHYVERFGARPFFLFVNFFDPHAPYRPPQPYDRGLPEADGSRFHKALVKRLVSGAPKRRLNELEGWERDARDALIAGYDAEITYMDAHLGRLLDALASAPRGDRTLIAITSDHGESFGEHDYFSHGAHLYEDNVRVPLMIRYPGEDGGGTRITAPVQNHRLFATLLAAAGVRLPDGVSGLKDLSGVIVTQVQRSDANVSLFGEFFDRDLRAIYDPPYKQIESSRGAVELFDLSEGAEEFENLVSAKPELSRSLSERLEGFTAARPPLFDADARAELSEETEAALRALGYID